MTTKVAFNQLGEPIDTVSKIRTSDLSGVGQIQTLGYSTAGDGGAGLYRADTSDTSTADDGYLTIVSNDSVRFKLQRQPQTHYVMQAGAAGDNSTDDTSAQQTVASALSDYEEMIYFPGEYLTTGVIDFKQKLSITIRGTRRASRIMFNHAGTYGFNIDNAGPTSEGRAISLIDMTFYSSFTDSAIPDEAVVMKFCPESRVLGCTFIECATVTQLRLRESWSASIDNHNFFSVDEPGLLATYGSPRNSTSTGTGLNIDSNSHAMTIHQNRIRTGYPSMIYGGGDASEISYNQIEGGKTNGLEMQNACAAIGIFGNYFEGSNAIDVYYRAAGTNFSHSIYGNYFHANKGVEIETNCDTNDLRIYDNNAFSSGSILTVGETTGYTGIRCYNNTIRNIPTPYDIPNSAFPALGLTYPDCIGKLNDIALGTTPADDIFYDETVLDPTNRFQDFSGSGTISTSDTTYAGIPLYEFTETGGGTYIVNVDFVFNNQMRSKYATFCMPFNTSSGNATVEIDDGVDTKTFTCNTGGIGADSVVSMFYYKLNALATRLRVKVSVGASITLQTLMPCVRIGMHDTLKHYESERERLKISTTRLEDISDAVNTSGRKVEGYRRYNVNTGLFNIAAGNADGSVWVYEGTGNTAHTPV